VRFADRLRLGLPALAVQPEGGLLHFDAMPRQFLCNLDEGIALVSQFGDLLLEHLKRLSRRDDALGVIDSGQTSSFFLTSSTVASVICFFKAVPP
jgi:hypothetical protein